MSVPDYQTLMLPILEAVGDSKQHTIRELFEVISERFQLSEEEISERVPSGRETKIKNRISWARTYLKKAGLVESPEKGIVKITDTGKEVLEKNKPPYIDNIFLRTFDGFNNFRPSAIGKHLSSQQEQNSENPEKTPEERLGDAHRELSEKLISDILESVRECTPLFFEQLVVDLMLSMGYGGNLKDAGNTTSQGNDNGIDGIINEDKLGLDSIYLQAKRWSNTIDRPEIDKFIGALTRQGARKGVFITTSEFSSGAREAAKGLSISIVLVDGQKLAQLMIDHDVGVSTKDIFKIKHVDSDYFDEI